MVDWTKPIRRKDGKAVRVIAEVKHPTEPMAVVVSYGGDYEAVVMYGKSGNFSASGEKDYADIENVPEERFTYLNVYPKTWVFDAAHRDRAAADSCASIERIGRMKIKLEERWDE